ncbi:MAG: DUF3021 family protein [Treponema sp.]|nr:DUF3021 family protein [Treponema sp.]
MKNIVVKTLFCTGVASMLNAAYLYFIKKSDFMYLSAFFQIFLACAVINAGVHLIQKIEIKHMFFEYLTDLGYILLVLIALGFIFNWFNYVPLWAVAINGAIVYILAVVMAMVRIRKDTEELNELIKRRKERNAKS